MSDQAQPHHRNQSLLLRDIAAPHDHDVLSGRGNFVNYHAGNEHFRALVRKHKVAYVACPKPQKAKFSRLIVDEVRSRDPPGRFLKQDNKTKLWFDIGDKKALDKTRQALREGAPDLLKELHPSDDEHEAVAPVQADYSAQPASVNQSGNANDMFSSLSQGGVAQAPPSVVTSAQVNSGTGLLQPGLGVPGSSMNINQTTSNVATATQNLETLQKQLTSAFSTEQFEPAPINTSLGIQIREAQAQLQALQSQLLQQQTQLQQQAIQSNLQQTQPQPQQQQQPQPRAQPRNQQAATKSTNAQMAPPRIQRGRFERESSLKFHDLFKDKEQQPNEKEGGGVEDVSAMSGMSFSVGNMTVSDGDEESNLSAVFEESVRISEAKKKKAMGAPPSRVTLPADGKAGAKQPSETQQYAYGQQSNANIESFDMSAMTLGSSTMQMSFNGGFGESQDLGKLTRKKEDW